jgi:hypothetical protein
MIAVDHDADLVVVLVSSPPEPNAGAQRQTQRRIVDALASALQ